LKLVYFPFPGRAGPIRDAFQIGKIAFTDEHIPPPEQQAQKGDLGKFPLGTVPVLHVNNVLINESNAILRYVGRRANLYSDDLVKAAKIDEALDLGEDYLAKLGASFAIQDEAKRIEARKALVENVFPRMLAGTQRLIENNGKTGFFVGDTLTIADLKLFYIAVLLTSGKLDGVPNTILDAYPSITL